MVLSYLCPSHARKRRSIVEDISGRQLGRHDHTTALSERATDGEKSCLSSNTVFGYLSHLNQELRNALDDAKDNLGELQGTLSGIKSQLAKITLSGSKSMSGVARKELENLLELKTDVEDEIQELSGVSVSSKWKRDMSIYTYSNNFSTCLGLQDCIESGLDNLNELPTMIGGSRDSYFREIGLLRGSYEAVLKSPKLLEAIKILSKSETSLGALQKNSLYCDKPPSVRLTSPAQVKEFEGKIVELQCVVKSALPYRYSWQHNNVTLPSETKASLRVFVNADNAGSYVCVAWNRAGQRASDETYLVLQKKPVFVGEPEDFTYLNTIRSQIKPFFECNVTSDSRVTFSWFKESFKGTGKPLRLHTKRPVLKIDAPTPLDSGYYYCQAMNQHGTVISRKARLDVLVGDMPKQDLSVNFDLPVETAENIDKAAFEKKVNEKAQVEHDHSVKVSVEPTSEKDVKLDIHINNDHSKKSFAYSSEEITMVKDVARTRNLLSEGIQRAVSGMADGDMKKSAEIERSLILGFDGNRCEKGSSLHENGFTCAQCAPGNYEFARECLPCPIGKYSSSAGSIKCDECRIDQVTSTMGARSNRDCVVPKMESIDLIFALGAFPENEDKIKKFVNDLVGKYIGHDTKVGIITYSGTAKTHLELGPHRINNVRATISSIKFESRNLQTPSALSMALDAFEVKSSSQRKKALVVLTEGNTADVGVRTGFSLVREESIKLHNLGVQVDAVWFGASESNLELEAMASFPKSNNVLYIQNSQFLSTAVQTVAATTLKGRCGLRSKDILIATESSASVTSGHWKEVSAFVTDFVTRLREIPENNFGFVSFGSSHQFVQKFRKFQTDAEVSDLVKKIPRLNGRVNIPNMLQDAYNWLITEKHGGMSKTKVIVLITRFKVNDSVFGLIKRFYQEENVLLVNVVMTLKRVELAASDLGVEESLRTVYSLSDLTELVQRMKMVGGSGHEAC